MISPLWQLTKSRYKMFFREKGAVFWAFGFPILLSMALGVAFRNRPPEPVRVAATRPELCDTIRKSPDFLCDLVDADGARAALRTGKAAIVVEGGGVEGWIYRFDPTRPTSRLARTLLDDHLQRAAGRADARPVAEQKVTEPGARYIDFLVPGLLGMNVMSSGMWGVGYVIVEFRTRKLIKRMLATPMRRTDFLLSFVFLRMLFLFIEVPLLLGFARLVFGVHMVGSYALFCGLAAVGALTFAGLGLLVASRAQNTQTVTGLMNLVMMPMFILSGIFFSTANFPDAMQPFIRFLPLTALNDGLRAILNDGAGPQAVARSALILAAWATVAFATALKIFRWRS